MDSLLRIESDERDEYAAYYVLGAKVKAALEVAYEDAIPVDNIRPYKDQPREYFDPAKLKLLSDAINASGQSTTGLVRKFPNKQTEYQLIDGERRWRAIKMIPEERRPLYKARVIVADDDVIQLLLSGISNFNREGHTPTETMRTIERMQKLDIPLKGIAELLGISESWAGQILGLRSLAPELLEKLSPELPRKEQLSVVAAIHISKLNSWPHQRLVADQFMKKKLPLAGLRSAVIKTATAAGVEIRLRELAPRKAWDSLITKISASRRFGAEVKASLSNSSVQEAGAGRPDEARAQIRALESTVKDLQWAAERIKKSIGM